MTSLGLATLVLSGCASVPSNAPRYTRAPAPPEGYATVYLYRVGAYPTLRTPDVRIDNTVVFAPPERAYTWLYVKDGQRKMQIQWAWDTKVPNLEFDYAFDAGAEYYVKISGDYQFLGMEHKGLEIEMKVYFATLARTVPKMTAEDELAQCCGYIAPKQAAIP